MKRYSKYLVSGVVFFAILSLVSYFLKLNWNIQILLFVTIVYIVFSFISDVFIAKKFAKNPAADVENLSEEESEKLKNLIDKGVLFLHVPKKPIAEQWDKEFDALVSEEAKENKKNYSDQFKWHLFSFDLLPALTGDKAKAAFDKEFDALVSEEAKENKKNYSDQFKWHLFSFDLLPALTGDKAKAAFDNEVKHELYLFFEYAEQTYIIGNANLLTTKDIDELFEKSDLESSDFYFFDPLNSWTYVIPHEEEELGPYFYKAK